MKDVRQLQIELAEITVIDTGLFQGEEEFAEAGYLIIFDHEEVKIYDGFIAKLEVSQEAIIKEWQDQETGLYWILLKAKVENRNTDTILLDDAQSEKIQVTI